ncbi:MAG: hypothetical protein LBQ81_00365 [Zoogloeaceae bacterium]|jgi:hypothetical protein|nr:hypothetical protein [Zoogloeaceae bacterium]
MTRSQFFKHYWVLIALAVGFVWYFAPMLLLHMFNIWVPALILMGGILVGIALFCVLWIPALCQLIYGAYQWYQDPLAYHYCISAGGVIALYVAIVFLSEAGFYYSA